MYYLATSKFKTFNEALEAVMKSSYSLQDSCLKEFETENFDELWDKIEEFYQSDDFSFGMPDVGIRDNLPISSYAMNELGLSEMDEEEKEYGMKVFAYTTTSGKNNVYIREVNKNGVLEYETIYMVASEKPLEYSTSMSSFASEGWNCSEKGYIYAKDGKLHSVSKGKMASFKESFENEIIKSHFSEDERSHLHYYANIEPSTIFTLLKSHPEFCTAVAQFAEEELTRISELELRNENPEHRKKVRATLIELKNKAQEIERTQSSLIEKKKSLVEQKNVKKVVLNTTKGIAPEEVEELFEELTQSKVEEH